MSDLFQIPIYGASEDSTNPFERFDLRDNPFPAAGVDSGVLYQRHMEKEIAQINRWIQEVGNATALDKGSPGPVHPLAIYGSIGVGKTHLLRYLQRGLSQNEFTPVLRKGLADEGMTRLVLANLFLRYLPFQETDDEPGTGLIKKIIEAAKQNHKQDEILNTLRDGSPIAIPFKILLKKDIENDAVIWMSRWLRREYTTPAQRAKLGIAGVLQSEGEAVRAVADLLRLSRAAKVLQVWFVMIDQLEELWRPGVITSSRRARFLTDLRHLVDQALEGAPIALLLAWNTTVTESAFASDVSHQMKRDYRALWQRLGNTVNLPPLSETDVWPFAKKYLEKAGVNDAAAERRKDLFHKLKAATEDVISQIQGETARGVKAPLTPRSVLQAWRDKALEIATEARQ